MRPLLAIAVTIVVVAAILAGISGYVSCHPSAAQIQIQTIEYGGYQYPSYCSILGH